MARRRSAPPAGTAGPGEGRAGPGEGPARLPGTAGPGEQSPGPRRRRLVPSVRLRAALAAALVVGAVLSVGALASWKYVESSMTHAITDSARQRAEAIVTALANGAIPEMLVGGGDEEFVQMYDKTGAVRAASDLIRTTDAMQWDTWPQRIRLATNNEVYLVERSPIADTTDGLGGGFVVVGRTMAAEQESATGFVQVVQWGIPGLMLVVAVLTWLLVGYSLRPVDHMRQQVDDITSGILGRRIAHPGGEDEIARLATTMNMMLERLEAAESKQRRFISDASHELRSPIAVIRQAAELSLTYPGAIDHRDFAAQSHAEALRLQGLVEDLLLLSRSDEGHLPGGRTLVDVVQLLAHQATRTTTTREMAGPVELHTYTAESAIVVGNRGMLGRLLTNLIDNAVRHAGSRVEVTVNVVGYGREVVILVADDGAGIAPEERPRVFERFVRLDEARARDKGGSGLGLAIVREIARMHDGEVDVVDTPLGGACFRVRLPAATPPVKSTLR